MAEKEEMESKMRKIIKRIIFTGIVFTLTACFAVAAESPAMLDGEVIPEMTQEELDKDSVMGSGNDSNKIFLFASNSSSTSNGWAKTSSGQFLNGNGTAVLPGAILKGIDVSKHQGTIDWSKVKKTDISFAIIRVGYGSDYKDQDDTKLKYNVEQCEKYNIPYGFYLYSYCNSASKNKSEIAHVLRLIKGTNPSYPVYYDLEDEKTQKCTALEIQSFAVNYCKEIKAAGYVPGIYASLSWWTNYLKAPALDDYEKWVARYNNSVTKSGYTKAHNIWQAASDYKVSGINEKVDLNFAYKDLAKLYGKEETTGGEGTLGDNNSSENNTDNTSNTEKPPTKTTGWVTKDGKTYYYNKSGVMEKSKWLSIGGYKYYATSKGYIHKNKVAKIGSYYYGFDSKGRMYKSVTKKINGKYYYFNKSGYSYLNKVKTKTRVHQRTSASVKSKSKGVLSKNKTLYVIRKSGNWWQMSNKYWVYKKYLKVTRTYPYK